MDIDGKKTETTLPSVLGYDGGAFSLMILKKIVFRASRPKTDAEIKEYKDYLAQNLSYTSTNMEIYTINADGTGFKTNYAPLKRNCTIFYSK